MSIHFFNFYNDKQYHYDAYYITLMNGWTGSVIVLINRDTNITSLVGTLDPTNATDDVFADGDTVYADAIRLGRIPVGINGSRIFISQEFPDIKISFYHNGAKWICGIDRTKVSGSVVVLNTVYCRA